MSKVIISANTSWFVFNFRFKTITRLLELGHEIHVLAPNDKYSNKLVSMGCIFHDVYVDGKGTSFLSELKSLCKIYFSIKRISPDFVFNSTIKMNIYVGLACIFLKKRYVNNISGLGTAFIHEGVLFRFSRLLYGIVNRKSDHVFFENEDDMNLFFSKSMAVPSRSSLLPGSGVDIDKYSFKELPKSKPFVFTMVSRLIEDKGVREYIEASKIIYKKNKNVKFILIGPSGVSNKTAITVREIESWENLHFIEYVGEQSNVASWLADTHVFVLPSYREGMPRSVLEALSIGRPAIVTDVPGCRQSILPEVNGWLCQPKSADDLARAMLEALILDDEKLVAMSKAARVWIEDNFSDEIVANRHIEIIQ